MAISQCGQSVPESLDQPVCALVCGSDSGNYQGSRLVDIFGLPTGLPFPSVPLLLPLILL